MNTKDDDKKPINRHRNIQITFNITADEKEIIDKKIASSGIKNKGNFYRKMVIDGIIVNTDMTVIKELIVSMNKIGSNINQITRRVNQSGKVQNYDLVKLNEKVDKIWHIIVSTLSQQQ